MSISGVKIRIWFITQINKVIQPRDWLSILYVTIDVSLLPVSFKTMVRCRSALYIFVAAFSQYKYPPMRLDIDRNLIVIMKDRCT